MANDNRGIVLDASERGLSMQVVRSLIDDDIVQMRFQIGQSTNWIETRARLAWVNGSRTRAGVQFQVLSSEGQILLTHWISSVAELDPTEKKNKLAEDMTAAKSLVPHREAAEATSVPSLEEKEELTEIPPQDSSVLASSPIAPSIDPPTAAPLSSDSRFAKTPEIPGARQERILPVAVSHRRNRFRLAAVLTLAIVVLGLGLFGLILHLFTEHISVNKTQIGPTVGQSASPTPQSPLPVSSVSDSEKAPGFVLQAGAMRNEENANSLVSSLEQKKVPVFIFTGDAGGLYEVLIGPYPDSQAAMRVREELRGQGFETFVRHWPSHQTGQSSGKDSP